MGELTDAVADTLKALAEGQPIDDRELAQRVGISPRKLYFLLNKHSPLNMDVAECISHHLGTDLETVIKTAKERTPDLPRRVPSLGETIWKNIEAGRNPKPRDRSPEDSARADRAEAILQAAMGRRKTKR